MPGNRRTVAVVGASADRTKYGNKAVRAFRDEGWEVYPIHPRLASVEGLQAYPNLAAVPVDRIDRISFYVPPSVGMEVIEALNDKQVGEVWLNPGAESPELLARCEALGLTVVQACSILAIDRSPERY